MARAPDIDVIVGKVPTLGYSSSVTDTRSSDVTAYTAGDVVGRSLTGTSVLVFPNIGPLAGGEVNIIGTLYMRPVAAIIASETTYSLYLYSAPPPSALVDNAPWDIPAGDRAFYVAKLLLGQVVDVGASLVIAVNSINIQVTVPPGGTLYGYLVTDAAFTPNASTVNIITIHTVAL